MSGFRNKPGSAIKHILGRFGIHADSNCNCGQYAEELDKLGTQWCEVNSKYIVYLMRQQATRQHLPFSEIVAGLIVNRAIAMSK